MAERSWSEGRVIPFPPARPPAGHSEIGDLRFRTLLGEAAWAALPEASRARFGKRVAGALVTLYAGEIVECRLSRAGRLLAEAGRLIGAPLPLTAGGDLPATVCVTEDPASGGQYWTRLYGRRRGPPQVIGSCKSFAGPTGLEERIGGGFGIALKVAVEDGALHFDSDHYFWMCGRLRLRLPRWLSPGSLRISHIDCNHGLFAFVLHLRHPWLGTLIRQTIMFREPGGLEE